MANQSEKHTLFQTKMVKIYAHFQTKTAEKTYPLLSLLIDSILHFTGAADPDLNQDPASHCCCLFKWSGLHYSLPHMSA